jgi:hypothetical protein
MNAPIPSSLDSTALARRLRELAGEERNVQVDFLLHLDEFDRRRAFLQAGYGSLWDYCLHALHLREGAAGRRIGAMRVLRRFPKLEGMLRNGRLCLSTLALLGQVLTDENVDDLVARAAYGTKAEVDHLVASVKPRTAPKDGIRKLPVPQAVSHETALPLAGARAMSLSLQPEVEPAPPAASLPLSAPEARGEGPQSPDAPCKGEGLPLPQPPTIEPAPHRFAEMRAVSEDQWSLRVTIDSALKEDLETLKMLVSHKIPTGDLAAVLREGIRCGIEKHGKRKGAVAPARKRQRASAPKAEAGEGSRTVPAELRRQVWERDGGRCTWVGPDGRRCGSRWKLEIDHIRPFALGGTPELCSLRLRCHAHNILYAEQVYGREHMAQFRREPGAASRTGEFATPGDSPGASP